MTRLREHVLHVLIWRELSDGWTDLLDEHLLSVGQRPLKLFWERSHPPGLVRRPAAISVQLIIDSLISS